MPTTSPRPGIEQRLSADGKNTFTVRWKERDGQRPRRTFETLDDALDFQARRRSANRWRPEELRQEKAARRTLGDFFAEWWNDHAVVELKRSTLAVYRCLWEAHAEKRLAHLEMAEIDARVVVRFRGELLAAGVGPTSVVKTVSMLQRVFRDAAEYGEVAFNPFKAVRKPSPGPTREARPLTPTHVEAVAHDLDVRGYDMSAVLGGSWPTPGYAPRRRLDSSGAQSANRRCSPRSRTGTANSSGSKTASGPRSAAVASTSAPGAGRPHWVARFIGTRGRCRIGQGPASPGRFGRKARAWRDGCSRSCGLGGGRSAPRAARSPGGLTAAGSPGRGRWRRGHRGAEPGLCSQARRGRGAAADRAACALRSSCSTPHLPWKKSRKCLVFARGGVGRRRLGRRALPNAGRSRRELGVALAHDRAAVEDAKRVRVVGLGPRLAHARRAPRGGGRTRRSRRRSDCSSPAAARASSSKHRREP